MAALHQIPCFQGISEPSGSFFTTLHPADAGKFASFPDFALDVMLMRIRVRALEGDQKAIRYLTELFGSRTALVETVKRRGEKLDLVRMFGW